VTKTVKVADARTEWRSILCETNATPGKIMDIQRGLKSAGFDPGPIDGVIRKKTMQAVNRYQEARGLPVDPYLNIETVKALGVNPG
jgi:peptidoglycan hydrolase-like protein with peptidoglycan-binding domain